MIATGLGLEVSLDPIAPVESDSDSWCTPKWLCDALGSFDIDPCSNDRSQVIAKCEMGGHGDHDDGLSLPWGKASVYCNPPYSNVMPWALKLAAHEGPWVALLKLDTTTRWWATLMDSGASWAPFRSRIKFERPEKKPLTANFPSVLVWSMWRVPAVLAPHLWIATYGASR